MPTSLRYRNKIYHCYVTINVKAFQPFQPIINSTKIQINQTACRPSHKLSNATSTYLVPTGNISSGSQGLATGETFVPPASSSCKKHRIKLKMSVVADGMNMLLGREKTTPLICVPPVAAHVYHAQDCTNNPTSKDKMMDRIRRFDVHRRERDLVAIEQTQLILLYVNTKYHSR